MVKNGFSLLEVIIAISILGTGILGSVALINRTISAGSIVKNQLVASNLAQEGMEVIHNIRHTNWIEEASDGVTQWDDGLVDGNSCIEFDSTTLINPGSCGDIDIEDRRLYILDVAGNTNYVHTATATTTPFYRHINITSGLDNGAPYKLVKSTVMWNDNSIISEGRIYNWK